MVALKSCLSPLREVLVSPCRVQPALRGTGNTPYICVGAVAYMIIFVTLKKNLSMSSLIECDYRKLIFRAYQVFSALVYLR